MAFRLGSLIPLILLVSTIQAFPTRIIVIRHGEKPSHFENIVPNVLLESRSDSISYADSLYYQGQMRASYLPSYFLGAPARPNVTNDPLAMNPLFSDMVGPEAKNPVTYIAAYYELNESSASFRPIETITPFFNVIFPNNAPKAEDLYVPSNIPTFPSSTSNPLDPDLKDALTKATGTAVLCWKHPDIPFLIQALGVPATNPTYQKFFKDNKYPDVFYYTFVITYDPSIPWQITNFEIFEQIKTFP